MPTTSVTTTILEDSAVPFRHTLLRVRLGQSITSGSTSVHPFPTVKCKVGVLNAGVEYI